MEDSKIVQLYWERDQSAIKQTAVKYGQYLMVIARNILGILEDAEECVNDTYLKAWDAMPPHQPERLSTFLGKITRNLALKRYERNQAEKRGGGELPAALEELGECVSGRESVEQDVEYQELLQSIQDFLASLSPEKRGIFLCRYWYTDSVAEIAQRYGMRENNVSAILRRTRLKLRTYLEERGYEV